MSSDVQNTGFDVSKRSMLRLPEDPTAAVVTVPEKQPSEWRPQYPYIPPSTTIFLSGGGYLKMSRTFSFCSEKEAAAKRKHGLYGFTLSDLELLLDLSRKRVVELIREGDLDPTDLETICFQWYRRTQHPDFKRRWPINVGHRVAEVDRLRAERLVRRKKRTYRTPDGKEQTISLPDTKDT